MKSLILITLILVGLPVYSQKKELPQAVAGTLNNMYPLRTEIKWKQKKDNYQIRFKQNECPTITVIDKSGTWIKTETSFKNEAIPDKIKSALDKKFPNGNYVSVKKFEDNTGFIIYRTEVSTENATFKVELDKNFKITKSEKIEEPKPENTEPDNG